MQARLQDIHAEIVSTMKQVHTVFKNDGPEVSIYTVCHTSLKFRKNKEMLITMHGFMHASPSFRYIVVRVNYYCNLMQFQV